VITLTHFAAFFLFPAMVLFLELGSLLRRRTASEGNGPVEGAVFALFGLLLAFTFSGAVSRFDAHRQLVTQEANAIGTAYLRLSLLDEADQPGMRKMMRDYTTSRLNLYDAVGQTISPESVRLQNQIWVLSVRVAASKNANPDATKLLLPALNDMIDVTSTRQNSFNMHPPALVFLLLFGFSCVSAFMAGYSVKAVRRDWVYTLAFALVVTLTVYATLEIEYPRQGLVRLTDLDQSLVSLRDSMR
jgi:hypothetical protein